MTNEATVNREIVKFYALSELLEILAAAFTGVGVVLAWGKGWIVMLALVAGLLLFLLSLPLRARGAALEAGAEELRKKQDKAGRYVVTAQHLRTLEVVGAGEDVVEALKLLLGKDPMPVEEFIRWFEKTLGRERAQEKLEVVRRYTLVLETPSEKQDRQEEREIRTAGDMGTGPIVFDPPVNLA
jgi:hypothetical protein